MQPPTGSDPELAIVFNSGSDLKDELQPLIEQLRPSWLDELHAGSDTTGSGGSPAVVAVLAQAANSAS